MNETLGRGYARIEALRSGRGEPLEGEGICAPMVNRPLPYYLLYVSLVAAGLSFLLPYNSFIMAADYFKEHYPDTSIMFDMSTVYIVSGCAAVVVNNMLVGVYTHKARIAVGLAISIATMTFVATCNIAWDGFSNEASYFINLGAIGLVAFGSTIQQASYYGFTSCLPPRYTQAVMVGESAAGLWVSMDRVITKSYLKPSRRNTVLFFGATIAIQIIHSGLHVTVVHNEIVQHYVQITTEARRRRRIQLHLNPNDDASLMVESETGETSYGILKLHSPGLSGAARGEAESAFSFSNPVYSPNTAAATSPPAPLEAGASPPTPAPAPAPAPAADLTPRTSYKVDDVVYESQEMPTTWRSFKRDVKSRWAVAIAIYPYMVSIGLVYFTTLSLYPGITTEVPSCSHKSWMSVILMSTFNGFDFLGKIAAAFPYDWSRSQLLMASGLRLLLVPLLLLCAAPRHSPHIVGAEYSIMFTVALGFTNGLFGSVPMIIAPSRVRREHREIAGNLMTLSYNGGLLSGTLVSYLLLSMLGAPSTAPCKIYPTPILPTVPPITMAPNTTYTIPPAH